MHFKKWLRCCSTHSKSLISSLFYRQSWSRNSLKKVISRNKISWRSMRQTKSRDGWCWQTAEGLKINNMNLKIFSKTNWKKWKMHHPFCVTAPWSDSWGHQTVGLTGTPERADRAASSGWGGPGPGRNHCIAENPWGGVCAWGCRARAPAVGGFAAGDWAEGCDSGCRPAGSAVLQWRSQSGVLAVRTETSSCQWRKRGGVYSSDISSPLTDSVAFVSWLWNDVFKDEASTLQLLKAHLTLEQIVETYAETVGMLSQQCQRLLELGHPERCGMKPTHAWCFHFSYGAHLTRCALIVCWTQWNVVLCLLCLPQWADHEAAVPHRPTVRISEGHGGAQKDQAGAAVLALSAQ